MTHIPELPPFHFEGGANITSDNAAGTALRQFLNLIKDHINTAIAYGYQSLGSLFTTNGSGNWQELTGLSTTVELPFDGSVHAIATIQAETAAGAGKVCEWAIEIDGDRGSGIERYLSGVNDVGSITVQHFRLLSAGTYTVKVMVKDVVGGAVKCLGQLVARGTP